MYKSITKKILELWDVREIVPNFDVLKILSKDLSKKAESIFFWIDKNTIFVLTTNRFTNILNLVIQKINQNASYSFDYFYTDESWFDYALTRYDKLEEMELNKKFDSDTKQNAVWIDAIWLIKKIYDDRDSYSESDFINEMIRLSFQSWSSDLHFQSEDRWVVFRIRKDWVMREIIVFSQKEFRKYLNKLKFMAWVRLNIDYIPQDWRFDFFTNINWIKEKIDVRVSFMPWINWENIVMRFLDWWKSIMSFSEIWFMDENLEILLNSLKEKYWMILVTWPTWSWKSTTLFSILNYLNDSWKKIITLEDPVEYKIEWIQQSQINYVKWYDYSLWLKAILRQDPDIIMVWEIRTLETAEIAINAALTWHLVLSTLHTNTAIESISRLLNMWIKPFMLWPALNIVIWQRLIRKLHDDCKTIHQSNIWEESEIKDVLKTIKNIRPKSKIDFDWKLYYPWWCEICWNDWYKWRIVVSEVLSVWNQMKEMITNWKNTIEIYWTARENWFLNMKEDWFIKLLKWITSIEEIRRTL